MVGRLNLFQGRMRVVLFMRARIIPAVKIGVILLLAMIRQGLAGNLPTGDAASVSERGHEQRVNVAIALKAV